VLIARLGVAFCGGACHHPEVFLEREHARAREREGGGGGGEREREGERGDLLATVLSLHEEDIGR
jgi:hypothetical protein